MKNWRSNKIMTYPTTRKPWKGRRHECELPMCERMARHDWKFCDYHTNRIKWLTKGELTIEC